jgi:hypothetical protein
VCRRRFFFLAPRRKSVAQARTSAALPPLPRLARASGLAWADPPLPPPLRHPGLPPCPSTPNCARSTSTSRRSPTALVKLSLLLAEDEINLAGDRALIESDMALAAAVMKAVNSSLYGLKGRVQSVQQAITYLGMREVAGITFEMGLRAAFPPAPELEPLWQRAACAAC